MYRGNEASRVGEVLAHRGNKAAMIAAAIELWIQPLERNEPDASSREVWQAIVDENCVADAVAAALAVIRDKRIVRSHAFIDIVEAIEDDKVLFELAAIVLECNWPPHPYLATIFLHLVDRQREPQLWEFIKVNRERLAATTPTWIVVAYILTATRIGSSDDLRAWFKNVEARQDVPMWTLAAFAVAIAVNLNQSDQMRWILPIARKGVEVAQPDQTFAYLFAFVMMGALRDGKDEEFDALNAKHGAAVVPIDDMAHPMLAWVNQAKHRHAITKQDFEFSFDKLDAPPIGPALILVAAQNTAPRPTNWRVVTHLKEYNQLLGPAERIMPLIAEMRGLKKGDPRAIELWQFMAKARPSSMAAMMPAWHRLVKRRIGFFTRIKLEFF